MAWLSETPAPDRFELVNGSPVAMAPEPAAHALTKGWLYQRLVAAVDATGQRREVFPDGMAVRIDETTVYEPDVMVRCGPPTPADAAHISDPIIIIGVLSPRPAWLTPAPSSKDIFDCPRCDIT